MKHTHTVRALGAIFFTIGSLGVGAQATPITPADWHSTTDGFGGLKQSQGSADIYFAVSKTGSFDASASYEMIDGFHWATSAEYNALMPGNVVGGTNPYHNQGGWSGYYWEGIARYIFLFEDFTTTTSAVHVGGLEGTDYVNGANHNIASLYTEHFAGFVLVADQVPESGSTLAMLGMVLMGYAVRRRR